jgi:hypothetical protein
MSHIVTITTQIKDSDAIRAACARLNLIAPKLGTVDLYEGSATGWIVQLDGWTFPIVCDIDSGAIRFDNYKGKWGEQSKLDQFTQAYAVEKARIESRKKGYRCNEKSLPDGSIRLTINA